MSFTFDGISCESFDMYVEEYPERPVPKRKATVYSVPGRSGNLIVDEHAWENVTQPYKVFVKGGAIDMQTRISAIAAWLVGSAGYKVLTDTYDTTVYRYARVANAVEFINSLNRYGRATLEFDCKPQRYPIPDEVFTESVDEDGYTFTYPSGTGLLPAYPLIEIIGKAANAIPLIRTNTLRINIGTPEAISKLVIDFAAQSIYNAYNNQWPQYTSVAGTWEQLGDGDTIYAEEEAGTFEGITVKVTTRRHRI